MRHGKTRQTDDKRAGSRPPGEDSRSASPEIGEKARKDHAMPSTLSSAPALESLKDLTRAVQHAEGFHPVVAALQNGRGASIDGAWGSSAALVTAALGLHAPAT